MARSTFQITPAQREFLRQLAYVSDRPMRAVLDDALRLLEAVSNREASPLGAEDVDNLIDQLQERYNGR